MNTHEEYVTYAQAKALKELGFDWPCKAWWESEYGEWIFYDGYNLSSPAKYNHQYNQWMFSAPTQAAACRWLREENAMSVESALTPKMGYNYSISYTTSANQRDIIVSNSKFSTYESALSAGIDRALELLKQS